MGFLRKSPMPISSKMACRRWERWSVIAGLKSITHDDRIFTLMGAQGVIVLALTYFFEAKLFVNFQGPGVAYPDFKPNPLGFDGLAHHGQALEHVKSQALFLEIWGHGQVQKMHLLRAHHSNKIASQLGVTHQKLTPILTLQGVKEVSPSPWLGVDGLLNFEQIVKSLGR